MDKQILLSFDAEEFDIPEEYGQKVSDKDKFGVSLKGLKEVLALLEKLKISATFFVTANFALKNKALVRAMAKKHEIASHGFYHSAFGISDLKKSRLVLEKIIGKKVAGFRMPRLKKVDAKELEKAGYKYDSSINPIYLPGRYNNFFSKRTASVRDGVLSIPVSASPIIRFPLFWLSFKVIPMFAFKLFSKITLLWDSYLSLYFHPWEFSDIRRFKMPRYIANNSGEKMIKKLENYLVWLKKQGKFASFSEFRESFIKKHNRAP